MISLSYLEVILKLYIKYTGKSNFSVYEKFSITDPLNLIYCIRLSKNKKIVNIISHSCFLLNLWQ